MFMSTDRIALLEQKIVKMEDEYGRKIKSLEDQLQAVMRAIDLKNEAPEDREWVSNSAGDWSIKVVYPGIYTQTHESYPTAGFPKPQNSRTSYPGTNDVCLCYKPSEKSNWDDQSYLNDERSRWPVALLS